MEPKEIIQSKMGLEIAFAEIEKVKIIRLINEPDRYLPRDEIEIRENEYHICNVIYNYCTLLVQFYQVYNNTPEGAYIVFVLVKGLFDREGNADIIDKPSAKEHTMYELSFDEEGRFGWRNKKDKDKDKFDFSEPLAEKWLRKFINFTTKS